MDGLFSTLIILMLGTGLAVTVYWLYNGKPPFIGRRTHDSRRTRKDKQECSDYRLIYRNENPYATEGPTELLVEVSDANHPNRSAVSTIYHDKQLVSDVVTFGRDESNSYSVAAPTVDRYEAFYLAKDGNTFKIKANPQSRNGLSATYKGRRIDETITFDQGVTLFMGNTKFSFRVPGAEPAQTTRQSIFFDMPDENARTKIYRR